MTRVNDRIRAPRIRVVDGNSHQQLGVMTVPEALQLARQRGLDLVEVSADAKPPVCKIVDYGKYKYEQSKNKDKTKHKGGKVKEVKFRANISENDYMIKLQHAEEFLNENNKLRVVLQFRGREGAHPEIGFARMMRIVEDLKTMGHLDMPPRQAGRAISMALSPLPANQRQRRFEKPKHDYVEDVHDDEDEDEELEDDHSPHVHTLTLEAVVDEMEDDNGRPKKRRKGE
ncbi:MAG: infc: translation initiation factor if-3 [Verrucomicrobiales bacterium]|nr:infc: translation initiation factor if-3 [Verrucomicrobiales bacterium]